MDFTKVEDMMKQEQSRFMFSSCESKGLMILHDLPKAFFNLTGGFLLYLLFKKPRYHDYMQSRNTNNPINDKYALKRMKKAELEFESDDEQPELFIGWTMSGFLLFTKKNLYFELNGDKSLLAKEQKGSIPLDKLTSITLSKSMFDQNEIFINGEKIGVLINISNQKRLEKIFNVINEIAKG